MKKLNLFVLIFSLLMGVSAIYAQDVTYTADFNQEIDFLSDGFDNTMWHGGGVNLGVSGTQNAEIQVLSSGDGVLTITSSNSDWSNAGDDGAIIYRTVPQGIDFEVTAKVAGGDWESFTGEETPHFNTGGIIVRDPNSTNINLLYYQTFDAFGIAYILKNTVDNAEFSEGQIGKNIVSNIADYPYQRITRIGNEFTYSVSSDNIEWEEYFTAERTDFEGIDLQVGLGHCTHSGGMDEGTVIFSEFTLTHADVDTRVKNLDKNDVKVYYDRTSQAIRVVGTTAPATEINVYNLAGSLIRSTQQVSNNNSIAFSNAGLYIVSVKFADGSVASRKVSVTR